MATGLYCVRDLFRSFLFHFISGLVFHSRVMSLETVLRETKAEAEELEVAEALSAVTALEAEEREVVAALEAVADMKQKEAAEDIRAALRLYSTGALLQFYASTTSTGIVRGTERRELVDWILEGLLTEGIPDGAGAVERLRLAGISPAAPVERTGAKRQLSDVESDMERPASRQRLVEELREVLLPGLREELREELRAEFGAQPPSAAQLLRARKKMLKKEVLEHGAALVGMVGMVGVVRMGYGCTRDCLWLQPPLPWLQPAHDWLQARRWLSPPSRSSAPRCCCDATARL